VSAPTCPLCGTPLVAPPTGRPPDYCSKRCRQAAWRARQATARATTDTTRARHDLKGARHQLSQAWNGLESALNRIDSTGTPGPGGQPAGWEDEVAGRAEELIVAARQVVGLATRHGRATADWQAAQTVLRRPDGGGLAGQETGSAAPESREAPAAGSQQADAGPLSELAATAAAVIEAAQTCKGVPNDVAKALDALQAALPSLSPVT